MTNIVLDTTFVLPLFGIKINLSDNFDDQLKNLWKEGIKNYNLLLPSACLIESMYMLNREFRIEKDIEILNRYQLVLPTIVNSNVVSIIDVFLNHKIIDYSNKIRFAGYNDLMDCLIAATAQFKEAIFLTRDKDLVKILKRIDDFKNLKIWSWEDLIEKV